MCAYILSMMYLISSCSSDDNSEPSNPDGGGTSPEKSGVSLFVITDPNTSSGLLISSEEMFSGTIDISKVSNATQIAAARTTGLAIDGAVYHTSNSAGDNGIQKFGYQNNAFTDEGFIAVNEKIFTFEVVSPTKGYYTDANRSRTAIQTFNPSTMQRTGEIDITEAITPILTDEVTSTRIGSFMLESKGKLYTQVFFLKEDGTHAFDISYVAVFDTTNDTFIGLTQHNDYIWLGFERKNSNYATVADNGDIYLASPVGNTSDPAHSKCIRIKAGSNQIDPSWKLDFNEFIGGNSFCLAGPAVVGDKLYIKLKSSAINSDYSNLGEEDVDAYMVDINTKKITKIAGIPSSGSISSSISGPVVIDGLVYFAVSNSNYQGYYTYNPANGEVNEAFSLSGGVPSQLSPL